MKGLSPLTFSKQRFLRYALWMILEDGNSFKPVARTTINADGTSTSTIPNDLEEMDLKWQLALLSMKARKFHQRTGKKIIINGSDTAGYDKTKDEEEDLEKALVVCTANVQKPKAIWYGGIRWSGSRAAEGRDLNAVKCAFGGGEGCSGLMGVQLRGVRISSNGLGLEFKGYLIYKGYTDLMKMLELRGELLILIANEIQAMNRRICYIKSMLKESKHLGISKEVRTLRYLSLVVPLTKVGDEAIHKELGDKMDRAAITASSLEAKQDSGSGPRGYTPRCDEGRKKLNELMELCTKLSEKVTSLEQDLKQTKQVYGKALTKLVKKGRMSKTKYGDVETEHAEEDSYEVHLDVLKRLSKATPEEEIKMMYYGSYGFDARQKVASRRR
ncbi:hypothetical protein Tco_0109838 [Tanacetum coccineum]